jgi:hypothetical protein
MVLQLDTSVQVDRDESGRIVELRHLERPYGPAEAGLASPTTDDIVTNYINEVAELYGLVPETTETLRESVSGVPADEGLKLRKSQEKQVAQTRVVEFQQTYAGLPIFNSSLRVIVAEDPPRVIGSSSNLEPVGAVHKAAIRTLRSALRAEPSTLQEVIGLDAPVLTDFKLNHHRLVVYRYDPDERYDKLSVPVSTTPGSAASGPNPMAFGSVPTLPLPEVPPSIQPGIYYIVRELLFSLKVPLWGMLNWRALVELDTGAVLYIRALTAGQTCCAFVTDPVSATGLPLNGGSPAADLDAARSANLLLQGLVPPINNQQALTGEFVEVRDTDAPTVPPPQEPPPFTFCYSSVTDGFAGASAYYHHDLMFRMVTDFGFPRHTYFDGSTFPVPVDHRGWGIVNAQAPGNTAGNGIGRFRYGLAASGRPVSIACDPRVCWHEFGHALLWDHVNSPNFGWCHSAGDTLAAILHDPETRAPDRFATFPFISALGGRRHDQSVAGGWAWGGTQDDTQYGSEQILSTTMFRIYRMSGGDDPVVAERQYAARYLAYLIFHAIGQLTATTRDPRTFVNALMTADTQTQSFDGRAGGVLHKVIRWSFEQQGLYQPPGAPRPVTAAGAPPDVDVFIDDGRHGGYEPYQVDVSATPGVWNRRMADGGLIHQQPAAGSANAIYVRVGNRGTQAAANVRIRVYGAALGGALVWPADFQALAPAERAVGLIAAGGETVVGPFTWMPARGGQHTILASVSATGDVSNAETVGAAVSSARLALLDNNVARRDIGAQVQDMSWLSLLLDDEPVDVLPAINILLTDD